MELTKFERARIIGARALQISMGAPLLIKRPDNVYNVIQLAKEELKSGVLPITVNRPKPKKRERRYDE
ncbi:MAG: DNA-directed RNA polymerase subunit K [Candidatus Woesearchaeota archaeon]|jgi:DNA-directed RNA polymerase subunit K